MPPFWAPPIALLYATFGTLLGIYALISPLSAARQFGLILPSTGASPYTNNEFVLVFGGRNIANGLMMFAFYWQQMPKAMGIVLLCIIFSGIVDTVVTGRSRRGTGAGSWTHALGTLGLGIVGWGMMS